MARRTITKRADELVAGDVAVQLRRYHCEQPLTAGRAKIQEVGQRWSDGEGHELVHVAYWYASRRCTSDCYERPTRCPHMNGSAGGGTGSLRADQEVEVYAR